MVDALDALIGGPVRLWRVRDLNLTLVAGKPGDASRFSVEPGGTVSRIKGDARLRPVPGTDGYYFEIPDQRNGAEELGRLLGQLLAVERDTVGVAQELSARYEEIDLLYTISDILGRTISLTEAAEVIVREVSSVVGARRASIFVFDEEENVLRPVAGWGLDVGEFGPIAIDHPESISARVFREKNAVSGNAGDFQQPSDIVERRQAYRGAAFLSAPITYPEADGRTRPVGVINLTDRLGHDSFDSGHRKLVAAIAHQIGAAIENARLVVLDRQRQRVRRELELAHDLQLRLLPSPAVLGDRVDIAARCSPGELVGGDFYQFVPLHQAVGVMLGDVSTHGFPAALIMALVLSAAGIHAAASDSPEEALERLLGSVRAELKTTEMFLSIIYVVIDPSRSQLRFANTGHPHAFLLRSDGSTTRLQATVPPLGLGDSDTMIGDAMTYTQDDLLVAFSDGLSDARNEDGEGFGEERVVSLVRSVSGAPTADIVDIVFQEVARFAESAHDDQTMLILRLGADR